MQTTLHAQRPHGDQSRELILYAGYGFGEVAVGTRNERSRDKSGLSRRRFPGMHFEQLPAADGKKYAG